MTEEQRAELEKLARALIESKRAFMEKPTQERMMGRPGWWVDYRAFADAAGPDTVLDLLATIARLEAGKVKDGEALEPFARAAGKLDGLWDDQDCRWNDPTRSGVTVAHIRAARARLSSRAKDQSQCPSNPKTWVSWWRGRTAGSNGLAAPTLFRGKWSSAKSVAAPRIASRSFPTAPDGNITATGPTSSPSAPPIVKPNPRPRATTPPTVLRHDQPPGTG